MRRTKIWKRTTALFLTAAMLISQASIPNMPVYAAEETEIFEPQSEDLAEENRGDSGAGEQELLNEEENLIQEEGDQISQSGTDSAVSEDGDILVEDDFLIEDPEAGWEDQPGMEDAADGQPGEDMAADEEEDVWSEEDILLTEETESESEVFLDEIGANELILDSQELLAEEAGRPVGTIDYSIKMVTANDSKSVLDDNGNVIPNSRQVSAGQAHAITVSLTANAVFGHSEAMLPYFKLKLPYFYIDTDDVVKATYDLTEVPEGQQGDKLMYMAGKLMSPGEEWTVFKDGQPMPNPSAELQGGTVIIQSAGTLRSGTSVTLNLQLYFSDTVAEGAEGTMYLGGGYSDIYDSDSGKFLGPGVFEPDEKYLSEGQVQGQRLPGGGSFLGIEDHRRFGSEEVV